MMIGQFKALTILAEQNVEQQKQKDTEKIQERKSYLAAALELFSDITAPTEADFSRAKSQQEIDSTLEALTRGMQMFDAILAIIENVQADSQTELLRKLIDQR